MRRSVINLSVQGKKGPIDFLLKVGKRKKTIGLLVDGLGAVTVYAPRFLTREYVKTFLQTREDWIVRRQERVRLAAAACPPKEYVSGELFPLFGRELRLDIVRQTDLFAGGCTVAGETLIVYFDGQTGPDGKESVRSLLRAFYCREIERTLHEEIRKYAPVLGVSPKAVRIGDQATRWGSCSPSGNLRFNWRLAMMPMDVVRYVVIHELSHLRVLNHSRKFWGVVESVCPDWQKHRRWLRENGRGLAAV